MATQAANGFGAKAFQWMREAYCGLHGHDSMLHFEKDRMSLQCASCGHETPGWEMSEISRPKVRLRGDSRRHVLRPHFVSERKIA
jgi:hypothetical protein